MSFYSPLFFLFFIGLIPIIIMYLLKKQHTDIIISSNYLWEKALKDVEANRPWQRLKKNLLLILQLLIFLLIVLSLAKPHIFSSAASSGNTIIVLDTSMSMQGKSKDSTRFDTAKKEAEKIIENLRPDTSITIITMDTSPNIILNSTKNKELAKKQLATIKPTNSKDNIGETLSLLRAMVKDIDNYSILFYTDKWIDTDIDKLLLNYIDGEQRNIAIDNISHSLDSKGITVLTTVTNYSDEDITFDLSLYVDDALYDVKEISLSPEESTSVYWHDIAENARLLRAEADVDDSLKADNIRHHIVNANSIKKALLVTKSNVFLEKAVSLNNNIELYKTNEITENINGYELYIFDGLAPGELPTDGNIIMIAPTSSDLFKETVIDSGEMKALNDELFRFVSLDFSISKSKYIGDTSWVEPVLLINDKPVIAKGQKENQKYVLIGFDLHDTDFPLQIDFPIFVQNMLDYSLNMSTQEKTSVLSGESLNLEALPRSKEISIIKPNSEKEKLAPPFPLAPYADTEEIGVYTIEQKLDKDTVNSYFVSNADTRSESKYELVSIEMQKEIIEMQNKIKGEKNIGNILLLIAILILAVEWVVYNRGN
ncbi:BatA and WFA domain-containing protein [Proteiniborus sp. MB09-C3]|uniref:vWA domain-containing protein n=1 Tax=Proteiniborus sp. MB09-C3 TaxID=3050072 RepID=UPI002555B11C|nr:BatA and WFA domain-containing protein [Proteiniborus sp. MB09-C3]WIV11506.1 BatA and WFA domain-containing protein [Proteiniborus sp. MB09-C3]